MKKSPNRLLRPFLGSLCFIYAYLQYAVGQNFDRFCVWSPFNQKWSAAIFESCVFLPKNALLEKHTVLYNELFPGLVYGQSRKKIHCTLCLVHRLPSGNDINSAIDFASRGPPPPFFAHPLLSRSMILMGLYSVDQFCLENCHGQSLRKRTKVLDIWCLDTSSESLV